MKVITTDLLNRFWKKGVKPILNDIAGKLDASKIINNLLTTEEGFALDARQGAVIQNQLDEINSNLSEISTGMHIVTREIEFQCPAGYSEYKYSVQQVGEKILCAIPLLTTFSAAAQRPTWSYNGSTFWVNCETSGRVKFTFYVFYT